MSFSGITAGATAKRAGTVSVSVEGVSAFAGAVCNLTEAITASTEAITASAEAICSFRWSYFSFCSFRWSRFLCFWLSFLFWKIYLMKFSRCKNDLFVF